MAATSQFPSLNLENLGTYSINDRPSKVSVKDLAQPFRPGPEFASFLESLPHQLAATDIQDAARATAEAAQNNKTIIFASGAHFIKVGLSPILIDMMDRGLVSAVALNGAGIIHDFELAYSGKTSEDVDVALGDGSFGMAAETAEFLNEAIAEGAEQNLGLGAAVGKKIVEQQLPYRRYSILGSCWERGITATIHVALGTDIIHIHPQADGSAIGRTSLADFRTFAAAVATLEGGVYYNIGSAVILPEVFLKAVTLARNLGHHLDKFTAVNLDFIRHYRAQTNVVGRPVAGGGKGITIIGHHELTFPLLAAAISSFTQ
jgi:hypothetical protein